MQKHLVCQRPQCVHILSMIMQFHTGNMYCGTVINVRVSIFMTNKHIISIQTQHPQLDFTFIASLRFVLPMLEFH